MGRNDDFYYGPHASDTGRILFQTREKVRKSTALNPGDMDAADVDYEMQFGKNSEELEIVGMNQSGLERFVEKYGHTYRRLQFFHCPYISDFSPLEDLKNLEMVGINWNTRADRLWDMSKNPVLWSFLCTDSKKLAYAPEGFQKAKQLRNIKICGPQIDGTYPLRNFECFAGIPSLEILSLHFLKPEDRSTSFLEKLPTLRQFNFDAGMFTTEEIARMAARYPLLTGKHLCAYAKHFSGIRVSGYRKPTLYLPKDQKRLEKYDAEFKALVEKYKAELCETGTVI